MAQPASSARGAILPQVFDASAMLKVRYAPYAAPPQMSTSAQLKPPSAVRGSSTELPADG